MKAALARASAFQEASISAARAGVPATSNETMPVGAAGVLSGSPTQFITAMISSANASRG